MNLNYSKLLNRKPISTDLNSIQDYIKGKRILVTGGAGSIGSEIVRQLVNFSASTVTVFDNAEASMFHLEQEISRNKKKITPLINRIINTYIKMVRKSRCPFSFV